MELFGETFALIGIEAELNSNQAASLSTIHALFRPVREHNLRPKLCELLRGPSVATEGGLVFSSDAQQSPVGEKTGKGGRDLYETSRSLCAAIHARHKPGFIRTRRDS